MRVTVAGVMLPLVLSATLWVTPLFALESPIRKAVQPSPPPSVPIPAPEYLMNNAPAVVKIGPGMFKMGDIVINKLERSISFPAQVNQKDGLLEYLLVHRRGKVHESLFKTDVEPYYLNLAFLLLSFEGTDRPLQHQGDPAAPQGEPVSITVSYGAGGAEKASPERWMVRRKYNDASSEEAVERLNWVYTGARVWLGRFAAQTGGSIVAVYHDPDAIIDNASPGGESDKIWFVDKKSALPMATPVTITIKSAK